MGLLNSRLYTAQLEGPREDSVPSVEHFRGAGSTGVVEINHILRARRLAPVLARRLVNRAEFS